LLSQIKAQATQIHPTLQAKLDEWNVT